MDSEHRHELKENDLKEFFTHFGEWWAKHGNTTLITVTLILLVVFGVRLYRSSVTSAHDNAWFDWANANSPASLKQVALDHSDPTVQAMAYLSAGDMLLKESLRSSGNKSTPVPGEAPTTSGIEAQNDAGATDDPLDLNSTASEPTASDALNEAQTLYTTVLNESQHSVFRINALLGLGAVAEARHDWNVAAQRYEAVQDQAGDYPSLSQKARARLALLPELKQPVTFAPEPVYTPETSGETSFDPSGNIGLPGFDMPSFSLPETNLGGTTAVEEVATEEQVQTLAAPPADDAQ